MKSIGDMIKDLSGAYEENRLLDNEWVCKFIVDIVRKTDKGKNTLNLTDNQVSKIEELHKQYGAVSKDGHTAELDFNKLSFKRR